MGIKVRPASGQPNGPRGETAPGGRSSGLCRRTQACLSLVYREWQLSCRTPAFWAPLVLIAGLSAWRAGAAGCTSGLAAYQARQVIVLGGGLLTTLLAGAAATRDRRGMAEEIISGKPLGASPGLALARFAGLLLSILALAVSGLIAAAGAQALAAGTPWRPSPYFLAFAQSIAPLAAAGALGFALASLFFTPLASGIAALYWITVPLARANIPSALDLTLTQHWPAAASLSLSLVCLTAALHRRGVRGPSASGARFGWVTAAGFALTALSVMAMVTSGEDALVGADPVLTAMSAQSALPGQRAPGFWLKNAGGDLTAMSDYRGRPAVVAFWSPAAPSSTAALKELGEIAREPSDEDVALFAICLDRDAGAVRLFSGDTPEGVLLLWDRGQHFGRGSDWSDSPVATAYGVDEVPMMFLLDRKRTYITTLRGEAGLGRISRSLSELLAMP